MLDRSTVKWSRPAREHIPAGRWTDDGSGLSPEGLGVRCWARTPTAHGLLWRNLGRIYLWVESSRHVPAVEAFVFTKTKRLKYMKTRAWLTHP